MTGIILVTFLFAFQSFIFEAKSIPEDCPWNYHDFPFWAKCSYTCGYEQNQVKGSPINIKTSDTATKNWQLTTPEGQNLESSEFIQKFVSGNLGGKWARNGYTFQFSINQDVADADVPKIKYQNENTLTPNDNVYKLWQVNYHWGKDLEEGSEHYVNGNNDPLEAHFVWVNVDDKLESNNRYLVTAVLYTPVDSEDDQTNWLKWTAQKAKTVARMALLNNDYGFGVEQDTHWNLYNTLKAGLEEGHWAYEGSLTTPNCNEQVTWIVGMERVKVFGPHLENFRKLIHPNTKIGQSNIWEQIRRNWRPTQDIGDRTVYSNRDPTASLTSGDSCSFWKWPECYGLIEVAVDVCAATALEPEALLLCVEGASTIASFCKPCICPVVTSLCTTFFSDEQCKSLGCGEYGDVDLEGTNSYCTPKKEGDTCVVDKDNCEAGKTATVSKTGSVCICSCD